MPDVATLEACLLAALAGCAIRAAAASGLHDGKSAVRPRTPLEVFVAANPHVLVDLGEHRGVFSRAEAGDLGLSEDLLAAKLHTG